MSVWANIKFFPEPTGELYGWLLATLVTGLNRIIKRKVEERADPEDLDDDVPAAN